MDCTYQPVLGSSNNWNIIKFTNKGTPGEDFDDIHNIVLDSVSENMDSLVKTMKYGTQNKTNKKQWDIM